MTITIEINGTRVEAENEKEARKALRKALAQAKKEEAEREAKRDIARLKANSNGYRILSRKASGEDFPKAWRFYHPGHKWAEHLFKRCNEDYRNWTHYLTTETDSALKFDHYGNTLLGAVCNGGGYVLAVFLKKESDDTPPICYALGTEGDCYALADCPGITMEDFPISPDK